MDEHFLGWARGGYSYSRLAGRSQAWVFLVSDGCSQKGRFIVKALTWMSTFWAGQGGRYSRLAGRSQGWVFLVSDGCSQKGRVSVKALTWVSTFWAGQRGGSSQSSQTGLPEGPERRPREPPYFFSVTLGKSYSNKNKGYSNKNNGFSLFLFE